MEKKQLELRLAQMQAEGTRFRAGVEIGVDITLGRPARRATTPSSSPPGATVPRDLPIPGRDLLGVHFAMDYLVQQNKVGAGDTVPDQITAEGKHVVVLGGGDTGADCIGTAHRQGALSVTNLAIGIQPPDGASRAPAVADARRPCSRSRARTRRAASGCTSPRPSSSSRTRPARCGRIRVAETEYLDGTPRAEVGHRARDPRRPGAARAGIHRRRVRTPSTSSCALPFDDRGNVARDGDYETSESGVFVAGDAGRGQSLIVWAIAEGRAAAAAVDRSSRARRSCPSPCRPTDRAIAV